MEPVTLARLIFSASFLSKLISSDLSKTIEILTWEIKIKSGELNIDSSSDPGIVDLERSDLSKIDAYRFSFNTLFVKFQPEITVKVFSLNFQPINNTALTIVLKTTGVAPIYWEDYEPLKIPFLPTVYRVQSAQVLLVYYKIKSRYIRKESSCTAGHVDFLLLDPDLDRIEYGTISSQNQMVMHELALHKELLNRSYYMVNETKSAWLAGRCKDLNVITNQTNSPLCQACFMHQYGLNRSEHNLTEMCEGVIPGPTTGVKRCYWAPLPKQSDFVKGFKVVDPIIDQDIANGPFCPPPELNIRIPDVSVQNQLNSLSVPDNHLPSHEPLIKLITKSLKSCHTYHVFFVILVTIFYYKIIFILTASEVNTIYL
ncbi:uncharacterized protein LOC142356693 [Convolutriloba macropyga]|uniref:uncharacterized protein LOC142356693 n=1 Tax=Convolutriloba macropyga TaxID=536237 RepID=UPI003F51CF8F